MKRICKLCGQEFTPRVHNQTCCDADHTGVCQYCGQTFHIKRSSFSWYASIDKSEWSCGKCDGAKKARSEAQKQSIKDKYGVENVSQLDAVRKKKSETMKSLYPSTVHKRKATCREKYGVDHVTQSPEFIEKVKEANQFRYGVDSYFQTNEFQEKAKATNVERYGVEYATQSEEIKEKRKQTFQERLGVDTPFQSEECKEKAAQTKIEKYGQATYNNPDKAKQTNLERYGVESVFNLPENRQKQIEKSSSENAEEKRIKTVLSKYGVSNVFQSDEIKEKIQSAIQDRYDVPFISQSVEWKLQRMKNPSRIKALLAFEADPISYVQSHFSIKPTLLQLSSALGVEYTTVLRILHERDATDVYSYKYSADETSILSFLLSMCSSEEIISHSRKLIAPFEIDFYIPKFSLGIEVDPTATHNSSKNMFGGSEGVLKRDYHQMKTDLCESKNILLFHLFSYEWNHKEAIIKSMIRNLLGMNEDKMYARNTYIKLISGSDAHTFLDENHRQGFSPSSINLGLIDSISGQLVSVMTFSRMRNTVGTSRREDLSNCWELQRFCNKLNTSVVGGASKLFKYFVTNYDPREIRSFSDRARTRGNLYSTLGFHELRRSDPGYVWVDEKTDIAYSRVNAQKQNIRKFLHDDSIDLSQTEKEIMESHDYVRVYDSGTITWQWLPQ